MIIHHADCLHVRIADRGSKKFDATLFQIFCDSIGYWCSRGNFD